MCAYHIMLLCYDIFDCIMRSSILLYENILYYIAYYMTITKTSQSRRAPANSRLRGQGTARSLVIVVVVVVVVIVMLLVLLGRACGRHDEHKIRAGPTQKD